MYLNLLFQTQPSALLQFVPILLIFAIFYFLLFMPMQKQKKQTKQMLENLQPGNVVQTSGGIVGTIVSISTNDDTLIVRVKPNDIKLQVARSAVAGLISDK